MINLSYEYEVLRTFALTHNYNIWIFNLLKPFLRGSVSEVGCGIGNLTRYFLQYSNKLTCIDKSPVFIKHMEIDYPKVNFYIADISEEDILNLGKKFDTVICVNVLEHVQSDEKALANMFKLLLPKGDLLLFVPALDQIYGTLDEQLGHFRRYNKKILTEKISNAGFRIKKISYSNFFGIFGWYLNSRILKRRRFSILQPLVFDRFVPLIAKIEKIFEPPIGMSLFVVAEKP